MNYNAYQQLFINILADPAPAAPYDDPHYLNYVRLNWSRINRWLKIGVLNEDLVAAVKKIENEQVWTLITEPWCGDAAHTMPFIQMIADLNPLIKVDYQLRDSEPFLINSYLTNGSKSIPKLIIADTDGNNIAVWGPRPAGGQVLFEQLVKNNVDFDERKIELQKWYNEDKGVSFQLELLAIINKYVNQ